jgi:uncharacterized membrane protein
MAGIGFVLKKLLRRNDLTGIVAAYLHGAVCSSGPWLLTSFALGVFYLLTRGWQDESSVILYFRTIVLYNFCFSLVFTASCNIVTTRYLSDLIYEKKLIRGPGMLIGSLFFICTLGLPIGILFYFFAANLPFEVAALAVINFLLISAIWQATVFVSALKQYLGVTLSFLFGMIFSVVGALLFSTLIEKGGLLAGFNLGLCLILASLASLVFIEYPEAVKAPFGFIPYFRKYWDLALGGLFYTLAIWVDKWIMWTAPEAMHYENNLIMYPHYDAAMFIASLTMVPSLALFLVTSETGFYERYLTFYRDIQNHVSLDKIKENHLSILNFIGLSARNLIFLQMAVLGASLLAAPKLLSLLQMNFLQLGMFRFGLLGVSFHVLALFCMILLSYFDDRRTVMVLQGLFLVANFSLTLFSKSLGYSWYGWGYFASSVIVFVASATMFFYYIMKLPYHTFISSNTAVRSDG